MDKTKPEFLKKLSKLIVVLIWVLSILITHNFYMLRVTIQLVTHAIDKNYMFLLCNGLLVFVAKCSGFIASSKPVAESLDNTDKTFDYQDFESYNAILELENCSLHGAESFLAEEVTETVEDYETVSLHVDSLEEYAKDEETEEEEEEEEEFDIRGGFKEEEENVGVVTVEDQDMNKKFDEFIRKMKEELRIEAKRQLILV